MLQLMQFDLIKQIFAVFDDEDANLEDVMENLKLYISELPAEMRGQLMQELEAYLQMPRTDQLREFLEIMPAGGIAQHPEGIPTNPDRIITNFEASIKICEIARELIASVEQ